MKARPTRTPVNEPGPEAAAKQSIRSTFTPWRSSSPDKCPNSTCAKPEGECSRTSSTSSSPLPCARHGAERQAAASGGHGQGCARNPPTAALRHRPGSARLLRDLHRIWRRHGERQIARELLDLERDFLGTDLDLLEYDGGKTQAECSPLLLKATFAHVHTCPSLDVWDHPLGTCAHVPADRDQNSRSALPRNNRAGPTGGAPPPVNVPSVAVPPVPRPSRPFPQSGHRSLRALLQLVLEPLDQLTFDDARIAVGNVRPICYVEVNLRTFSGASDNRPAQPTRVSKLEVDIRAFMSQVGNNDSRTGNHAHDLTRNSVVARNVLYSLRFQARSPRRLGNPFKDRIHVTCVRHDHENELRIILLVGRALITQDLHDFGRYLRRKRCRWRGCAASNWVFKCVIDRRGDIS